MKQRRGPALFSHLYMQEPCQKFTKHPPKIRAVAVHYYKYDYYDYNYYKDNNHK